MQGQIKVVNFDEKWTSNFLLDVSTCICSACLNALLVYTCFISQSWLHPASEIPSEQRMNFARPKVKSESACRADGNFPKLRGCFSISSFQYFKTKRCMKKSWWVCVIRGWKSGISHHKKASRFLSIKDVLIHRSTQWYSIISQRLIGGLGPDGFWNCGNFRWYLGSMYGIFAYIYCKRNQPFMIHVGKYIYIPVPWVLPDIICAQIATNLKWQLHSFTSIKSRPPACSKIWVSTGWHGLSGWITQQPIWTSLLANRTMENPEMLMGHNYTYMYASRKNASTVHHWHLSLQSQGWWGNIQNSGLKKYFQKRKSSLERLKDGAIFPYIPAVHAKSATEN